MGSLQELHGKTSFFVQEKCAHFLSTYANENSKHMSTKQNILLPNKMFSKIPLLEVRENAVYFPLQAPGPNPLNACFNKGLDTVQWEEI